MNEERLLLAVSGGVDSMVLAHLTHHAGYTIGVAHVNYGLRGEESDGDEELVRGWCAEHEVPFFLKKVPQEAYDVGESIQMVAREIRYEFFDDLMKSEGYDGIVTAHNLSDNVETVLLNLVKGTGIYGLTGMHAKRDHLFRPLLFATKEEICEFAREAGISWREDRSNAKNDYQRNLIRNEVVPLLKEINPNLEHTMTETLTRLNGTAEMVDTRIQDINSWVEYQGELQSLDLQWWTNDGASLVLLTQFVRPFGFQFADAKDLHTAISNGESGKMFHSSTHQINLDRGVLLISPQQEDEEEEDFYFQDQMGQIEVGDQVWKLKKVQGNNFPKDNRKDRIYLDLDLIEFPLVLRSWHQGDYFQPLGMSGKKKVSDFMIDNKIPVTLKKHVKVLESGNQIVWLVNHRLDDRCKVTDQTRMMLRIEIDDHA